MEEIEWRLRNCNDAVLIAQTTWHLVALIEQKLQEKPTKAKDLRELTYLKSKCWNEDVVISGTAARGVLKLVESNLLNGQEVLSEFLAAFSDKSKSHNTAADLVCTLMLMDFRYKLQENDYYEPVYRLTAPQHPLVTVLLNAPQVFESVTSKFMEVHECHKHNENEDFAELFRPFYCYVFLDPFAKLPREPVRNLWSYLITQSDFNERILPHLMHWLQLDKSEEASRLLQALVLAEHHLREVALLWLHALMLEQCSAKADASRTIRFLQRYQPNSAFNVNVALLLVTKTLPRCSSANLAGLLRICINLLKSGFDLTPLALQAFKGALLHWQLHANGLVPEEARTARELIAFVDAQAPPSNLVLPVPDEHSFRPHSGNEHVFAAARFLRLAHTPPKAFLQNLSRDGAVRHWDFLCALFLSEASEVSNGDAQWRCLEALLAVCEQDRAVTPQLLTLLLFKLSKAPGKGEGLLFLPKLLRAVPRMGVLKENLPLIVNVLKQFSGQGDGFLGLFGLELYHELWRVQVRCYPLLQQRLGVKLRPRDEHFLDFCLLKARIVKDVCERRPELHGTDMVAHISSILNDCKEPGKGALACSLALEALRFLCLGGVVDLTSAWTSLEQTLTQETRRPVLRSVCRLAAAAATDLDLPELSAKLVPFLWGYVVEHQDAIVAGYAAQTLQEFEFELLCEHFPQRFNAAKNLEQAREVAFNYVPGNSWVLLLKGVSAAVAPSVAALIGKLMGDEVGAYRNYVYEANTDREEPSSYNYLQPHSLVRAFGNYVRHHIKDAVEEPEMYERCLGVLGSDLPKPLPPFDWCFLQELLHEARFRQGALAVAARNVTVSNSARSLVENLIFAASGESGTSDSDSDTLYANLRFLCNSIQPQVLQPFLTSTFEKLTNNSDLCRLQRCCGFLRSVLEDLAISDVNKRVIAKLLFGKLAQVRHFDDQLASTLLDAITVLPWPSLAEQRLEPAEIVATSLVMARNVANFTSLTLIDQLLLEVSSARTEVHKDVLSAALGFFRRRRADPNRGQWLVDFLARFQVGVVDCAYSEPQLLFLCDVVLVAAVAFGDLDGGVNERHLLFAQSLLAALRSINSDAHTTQVLEWLLRMSSEDTLPPSYRRTFYEGMAALRHEGAFRSNFRWMKYVESKLPD